MIDDVPGEVPDDSPWRPGADVRFDHLPIRPFDEQPTANARDLRSSSDGGTSASAQTAADPERVVPARRMLAAVLLPLAIVGAAVIVRGGSDGPSGDVAAVAATPLADAGLRQVAARDLGGDVTLGAGDVPLLTAAECPAQRLPMVADPLWNVELTDALQIVTPIAVSAQSVVAVVGFDEATANGLPSASVVALDVDDGKERWRTGLDAATGRHEIIGIVDGSVIVQSAAGPDMAYRRLFAIDEASGSPLWDRGFRGDWSSTVDTTTGRVYVSVRRPAVSATDESEVAVLDPRTGDRLHIAGGAFFGLDADGRLITRLHDDVLATSVKDRELLGVVDPSDAPFAVVGSRVIVAEREPAELSIWSGDGERRRFPLIGSTGIDAPGFVVSLDPLGGSSLVVNGDGSVHGAQVGDTTVEIRWRLTGVALASAATDRGRSLLIATEGGAQQRVIDGSTGRTIVHVGLRPGSSSALALVANGVVVQEYVDGERTRVAVDLDGRELWSLPGSGALAVGNGVAVDVDESDAAVRVSAWGDPVEARTDMVGCRSVMTEWIPR